jgi:hypothetical protein
MGSDHRLPVGIAPHPILVLRGVGMDIHHWQVIERWIEGVRITLGD